VSAIEDVCKVVVHWTKYVILRSSLAFTFDTTASIALTSDNTNHIVRAVT
jgi:hypothetical protein